MMLVILSYDVGAKQVGKISKIAKKYLRPVQRSLYQGFLSEKQLESLKSELKKSIDCDDDSVVIYKTPNCKAIAVDEIGIIKGFGENIL